MELKPIFWDQQLSGKKRKKNIETWNTEILEQNLCLRLFFIFSHIHMMLEESEKYFLDKTTPSIMLKQIIKVEQEKT